MSIKQRQIVEVEFRLPPDGKFLRHPCIVLSNEEINEEEEEGFIGVMLTSQSDYRDDEYSFEIHNDMLTKPHDLPFCAARMHLIGYFLYKDIIKNSKWGTEIRSDPFRRLVTLINRTTFQMQMQLMTPK
jgi:PemK-like, MazF-like toxin of type II toxin-antitoxin system